jgi:hypothetical protein
VEQDTIRARSIELVNEYGDRTLVLDGGGSDAEPGMIIYSPDGPVAALTILVRREDSMPMFLMNTIGRGAVLISFQPDGQPILHLRAEDGSERSITPRWEAWRTPYSPKRLEQKFSDVCIAGVQHL